MQIQRLKIRDVNKALQVVSIFKGTKVSKPYIQKFLSNDKNYLIVAYQEENPTGFILGYELQRMGDEEPMMFIYEIETLKKYRRQGIARALIGEFQKICREKGFREMFVITNESNIPAMNLYKATGGYRSSQDDVVFGYDFKKSTN